MFIFRQKNANDSIKIPKNRGGLEKLDVTAKRQAIERGIIILEDQ